MDIYNYLKKDHKKVSALFKKITFATTAKIRKRLFLEIKMLLTLHADPEKNTFYEMLNTANQGKNDVKHGNKEHDEIKKALNKIDKISPKELAKWYIEIGKLIHLVEHHVEDEELNMFENAKKIISQEKANDLVVQMEELKNKMRKSKKFMKDFSDIL